MPPHPPRFVTFNGGELELMSKVVIVIGLAVVAIAILSCVGDEKRLKKKRVCGNKHHETWTGKPEDDFLQYAHPTPPKSVLDLFDKKRMAKPKYCTGCVNYAKEMLNLKVGI